jgi:hypothetical protein
MSPQELGAARLRSLPGAALDTGLSDWDSHTNISRYLAFLSKTGGRGRLI